MREKANALLAMKKSSRAISLPGILEFFPNRLFYCPYENQLLRLAATLLALPHLPECWIPCVQLYGTTELENSAVLTRSSTFDFDPDAFGIFHDLKLLYPNACYKYPPLGKCQACDLLGESLN